MSNEYGLDADYMRKNLNILVRDIDRYTPDGMMRALHSLSMVAADQAGHKVTIKIKYGEQPKD